MICWGERTEMPEANQAKDESVSKIHVEGAIPSALRTRSMRKVWVEELVIDARAAVAPAIWAQSGITGTF